MSAAAMLAPTEPREIPSAVLGSVWVTEAELFQFPDGLFGFRERTRWVLVPAARAGYFWLQSAEDADLALLAVDPFEAFPGYGVELTGADLRALGDVHAADVLVLAIVTLPAVPGGVPTANLRGPVALAPRTRRGRQVVVTDRGADTRALLAVTAR